MARWLKTTDPDFNDQLTNLIESTRSDEDDVRDSVAEIIKTVRRDGFAGLKKFTAKFDNFDLCEDTVRFSEEEIDKAYGSCAHTDIAALEFASNRIRLYHEKQRPEDISYKDETGTRLGWRWTAVDRAGLYTPGGRASYPSSVLMNAIPARVAGVDHLTMCVPMPNGELNPLVLAAAKIANIDNVLRIGGAQAIAAMAYGAAPIAPVDVIVGPGNAYVAEAKRQVFGQVGIDAVAGPSEILVVADGQNDPAWIAADLLSQAEHDPSSQSILVTDDGAFAKIVVNAVQAQTHSSPRRNIIDAAWQNHAAVIIVDRLDQAADIVNRLAPEHLELAIENPERLMKKIRHAGAIFLGRYSPEAVGDYVAGPDHVLPTAGCARYASGLSVLNFMKRTSIIECDAKALRAIGRPAARLADAEGLPAHAYSIKIRLEDQNP